MGDIEKVPALVVCHDCDLVQRRGKPSRGERAQCARCGAVLQRGPGMSLQARAALVLTGLVVFVLANVFPLVVMSAQGARTATTLVGAALALWRQGMAPVAFLVIATAWFVPLAELLVLGYLLFPPLWRRAPPGFERILRVLHYLHPWGMAEVFLMGVLVALVKLAHLADVVIGQGLWAFCVLILLLALNASQFDSEGLWACCRALKTA
ncbi:MAG: paraquat-inducible protein A [Paludibacterium sp.]|uniref:paraquat-inducible protein A n=1 Tax=Paludibacterium sp. TaxID=1917523 RepID=UPI0025EFC2DB|nr:paraquat-inducible protein A [Paludibacterium sp.]MBV8047949.1 paraquat-inducible protein A [Paludibacterium sp.]MBV8647226.1 paraquat-inducible protein A [Paludibacterium sp.]